MRVESPAILRTAIALLTCVSAGQVNAEVIFAAQTDAMTPEVRRFRQ